MKFIIGKKMAMTQIWNNDQVMAVTPVQAGPCLITQIKTKDKDGYEALQLAYGKRKAKNISKPQLGHVKGLDLKPQHLREFRTDKTQDLKIGDSITVDTFSVGDNVMATGTSKGKGFQGVVKRHGFHGFRKTHGNKDQERMPGSIGPKGPAHVFKGTRMAGRMGNERVTVTNLEVAKVDAENNVIFIKGALPGAINGLILLKGQGDLQVNIQAAPATVAIVDEAQTVELAAETDAPVLEEVKEENVVVEESKAEEIKVEETKVEEAKVEELKVVEVTNEEDKKEEDK